jgi:ADP-heptose:LPS heptosyltransferase
MKIKRIMLSRTDSIGDVLLTLPMAGFIKKQYPGCEVEFLGSSYTKEIAETSVHIDSFHNWSEISTLSKKEQLEYFFNLHADVIVHVFPVREIAQLARKARIPLRIGTSGRLYHYHTCNRIVLLSRKRSDLHEAQLNLKLIQSFGIVDTPSLHVIGNYYGFNKIKALDRQFKSFITKDRFNLAIHPKTKGSAREWGLHNFSRLLKLLPRDKFRIFITGTEEEGKILRPEILNWHPDIIDMTGKFTLGQFIGFLNEIDGLVSASTGPLHIAAALGKYALGIYPPIKPMHPGRWAPVGLKADYLVMNKKCSACRRIKSCKCIEEIAPEAVCDKLLAQYKAEHEQQ